MFGMSALQKITISVSFFIFFLMNGCDNDHSTNKDYRISVTNLTSNQPLSPVALVFHDGSASLWEIGEPATNAIEQLAESGNNTPLLNSVSASNAEGFSGSDIILPGSTEILDVSVVNSGNHFLSIASMLTNTNDAFAGYQHFDLLALFAQTPATIEIPVYDSGTELNTETLATIPGPAGGGEGYNMVRDDLQNQVTRHQGVVSATDGLTSSALNATHRFSNPVALISIQQI